MLEQSPGAGWGTCFRAGGRPQCQELGLAPLHRATLWESWQSLSTLGCWHSASGVLVVWGQSSCLSLLCQGCHKAATVPWGQALGVSHGMEAPGRDGGSRNGGTR